MIERNEGKIYIKHMIVLSHCFQYYFNNWNEALLQYVFLFYDARKKQIQNGMTNIKQFIISLQVYG